MKISRKGEYALRAMIYLALNEKKGYLQSQEIAQKEDIPIKFLEQILLELRNSGLLESRRGIGGGYKLLKSPTEINLAQIIRIIDGPLAPLSCVSQWAHISCPEQETCGLYSVMLEVRNAIVKILEKVTIADVCARTTELRAKVADKSGINSVEAINWVI